MIGDGQVAVGNAGLVVVVLSLQGVGPVRVPCWIAKWSLFLSKQMAGKRRKNMVGQEKQILQYFF